MLVVFEVIFVLFLSGVMFVVFDVEFVVDVDVEFLFFSVFDVFDDINSSERESIPTSTRQ